MNKSYTRITTKIKQHENKKAAAIDKKYHKYNGHHALGIKAPVLGAILKEFRTEIKSLSCDEVFDLAQSLYQEKIEEFTLAANFVLQLRIECITKTRISFFDTIVDYFTSWSQTDDFCIDVLQPILVRYPKETLSMLKKWNKAKNMWKRRASVVAFVRKVGENGKFTDEALALCDTLIWDKEDLVQKGVGWCLKDIMRGDKKRVIRYIKNLRKQNVSSKITLYAIRDLKGEERSSVLRE